MLDLHFLHINCHDIMFLQQYLAGHEVVICDALAS